VQRASLIDPMAPNPSVETLAAPFIAVQIRRTTHHSTAVLSLTDQPDGEQICGRAL